MSGLRILHLLASPYWSGPAEPIFHIALAQRAMGHQASVAVDRKRSTAPSEELAVPRFREAGLLDEGGLELSTHSSPLAMWRDCRRLRTRALDVVHAHMTHDHFIARFGRPSGAVLVRSIHAPRSRRASMPSADAYTVSSDRELAAMPGAHAIVLPAFAGPEFTPPADRASLRHELGVEGAPVIGMISSFQASRRHAFGIRAFARLLGQRPAARLCLIGDGALEGALRAQVQAMGLESRVTFTGYQGAGTFLRWLQCLDQVWILGLGNEHGGRAAAQARAVGARVLAVPEGGLAAVADVVVPVGDEAALAVAALSEERRDQPVPRREAIAIALLELYQSLEGP